MATFRFNSLLREAGFAPKDVSMILHTTRLPKLRHMLPYLVGERPELFDAYNSVHNQQATTTLLNRPYAATFVPTHDDALLFVGLHMVDYEELPVENIYNDPRFQILEHEFGAMDVSPSQHIANGGTQVRFAMSEAEGLREFLGRIQISAPKGRTYVRIADKLDAQIVALSEESLLIRSAPNWDELIVTGSMLRALPLRWAARLREWRGVYLIVDEFDGARYVGAAYGEENLLGRWRAHVAGDQGITKELKKRDPLNFRFSILQLLAPDAKGKDVISVEHNWMLRLHSKEFGLNT